MGINQFKRNIGLVIHILKLVIYNPTLKSLTILYKVLKYIFNRGIFKVLF